MSLKAIRITYKAAGISGLLLIVPQLFLEERIGKDLPPAVTHPEYFYGFIGLVIVFQVLFLIIARNPVRYREIQIAAILEKASFLTALAGLAAVGRAPLPVLAASVYDLFWFVAFLVAWRSTPRASS